MVFKIPRGRRARIGQVLPVKPKEGWIEQRAIVRAWSQSTLDQLEALLISVEALECPLGILADRLDELGLWLLAKEMRKHAELGCARSPTTCSAITWLKDLLECRLPGISTVLAMEPWRGQRHA